MTSDKQDSPPVGNRKRHNLSKHNLSRREGCQSYLGVSHPSQEVCNWDWGTPPPGTTVPPRKDMGPVEVLWDGDGIPPERTWNQ